MHYSSALQHRNKTTSVTLTVSTIVCLHDKCTSWLRLIQPFYSLIAAILQQFDRFIYWQSFGTLVHRRHLHKVQINITQPQCNTIMPIQILCESMGHVTWHVTFHPFDPPHPKYYKCPDNYRYRCSSAPKVLFAVFFFLTDTAPTSTRWRLRCRWWWYNLAEMTVGSLNKCRW